MLYIVTTKDPRNPLHDPHNKMTAACTQSTICTDATGAHHSFLLETSATVPEIKEALSPLHVTRIEAAVTFVWHTNEGSV